MARNTSLKRFKTSLFFRVYRILYLQANLQRQTDENQMTKAKKVCLLTTADQDHQRQLEELQQENEADILLLADKEVNNNNTLRF